LQKELVANYNTWVPPKPLRRGTQAEPEDAKGITKKYRTTLFYPPPSDEFPEPAAPTWRTKLKGWKDFLTADAPPRLAKPEDNETTFWFVFQDAEGRDMPPTQTMKCKEGTRYLDPRDCLPHYECEAIVSHGGLYMVDDKSAGVTYNLEQVVVHVLAVPKRGEYAAAKAAALPFGFKHTLDMEELSPELEAAMEAAMAGHKRTEAEDDSAPDVVAAPPAKRGKMEANEDDVE
jgi:hypothetical protein